MRNYCFSIFINVNISAADAWTIYVLRLCSQAWFLAASTNLWTSGIYDGSSLDKLYIQKDLSIITYGKISTLIDPNAKQV